MNLLCDSEHERLNKLRSLVTNLKVRECASPFMKVYLDDLAFVLRYVGELEAERFAYLNA